MKWINHKAHTPFLITTAGKDHRVNLCWVPGNQEAIPQGTDKFPGDLSDLLTCSRASSLKSPFRFVPDNSSSQVNSSESVTSPNGLKSISHTFPCRTERKPSKDKIKSVSWLIRKMILFYPKSSHFILKIVSLITKDSSSKPHLWRAACLSRAGTEPQEVHPRMQRGDRKRKPDKDMHANFCFQSILHQKPKRAVEENALFCSEDSEIIQVYIVVHGLQRIRLVKCQWSIFTFYVKYTNSRGQWRQWSLLQPYVRSLNILINDAIMFNILPVYFLKVCLLKTVWNNVVSNKTQAGRREISQSGPIKAASLECSHGFFNDLSGGGQQFSAPAPTSERLLQRLEFFKTY